MPGKGMPTMPMPMGMSPMMHLGPRWTFSRCIPFQLPKGYQPFEGTESSFAQLKGTCCRVAIY